MALIPTEAVARTLLPIFADPGSPRFAGRVVAAHAAFSVDALRRVARHTTARAEAAA